MALSSDDRVRLAKLLGMLGSDFEGEVINAAKAAQRLIKNAGETWESVIVPATANNRRTESQPRQEKTREQPKQESYVDHKEEARRFSEYTTVISEWEAEFLESIKSRYSLSEKQQKVLARIREKIEQFEKCKEAGW